ncbi:MAG: hypothetical protein B1H08_01780 [Candidatus Omnitrophica bacterium 4484_171]|nr:MAG: hypothetical protein B1H08_01780 [Candidatus Omnitrophica bacterium 4484_171]
MKEAIKVYREAFNILKEYPRVIIPFAVTGICNVLALYIVYLIPQRPFVYLFGPPVKAFWGMKFLHYPFNLYLLPKLFYYASICVGATVGALMSAAAIGMIRDYYTRRNIPSFLPNFSISLKRYFALFGIWFVTFIISFYSVKAVGYFSAKGFMLKIVPYIMYSVSIIVQLIFIYAVPALIIEKRKIMSSIARGVGFLRKAILPTLIFVLLPAAFYLPVLALKHKGAVLMGRLYPEIIIAIVGFGILVSFVIDVLVTIFTTLIFLDNAGDKR